MILSDAERDVLDQVRPAGIILFARNAASADQVRELTASLGELEHRPFVCIDLEGGMVNRLSSHRASWRFLVLVLWYRFRYFQALLKSGLCLRVQAQGVYQRVPCRRDLPERVKFQILPFPKQKQIQALPCVQSLKR